MRIIGLRSWSGLVKLLPVRIDSLGIWNGEVDETGEAFHCLVALAQLPKRALGHGKQVLFALCLWECYEGTWTASQYETGSRAGQERQQLTEFSLCLWVLLGKRFSDEVRNVQVASRSAVIGRFWLRNSWRRLERREQRFADCFQNSKFVGCEPASDTTLGCGSLTRCCGGHDTS